MAHSPSHSSSQVEDIDPQLLDFYSREYLRDQYAPSSDAHSHPFYEQLNHFITTYGLQDQRCLEVGCGRGAFQNMVENYTGIDITESVRRFHTKSFVQTSATSLPFEDNHFDAIWSYAVLEHIPNPELALTEMRRVLRPGGLLLLAPAWQCRSWAADGYPVRPYSDFDFMGKLIKASIPIRESVLFRASYVMPRRVIRWMRHLIAPAPTQFRYRHLKPNYDHFWMSDSDALNMMDPYETILWFTSRGDRCLSYPKTLHQLLVRTGGIIFSIDGK